MEGGGGGDGSARVCERERRKREGAAITIALRGIARAAARACHSVLTIGAASSHANWWTLPTSS